MEWLLSNEDFDAMCGNSEYVWVLENLWNNGIICENHAVIQFIYSITEYDSPDCPFCGAQDNKHYKLSESRWKCKKCKNKFSLTSGRYLDNTKMPITYWWRFCWVISKSKLINSCAIARDLEITQKTAWYMIDTLKQALKNKGAGLKNGSLEFKDYYDVIKILMQIKNIQL